MNLTKNQIESIPFKYAYAVRDNKIVVGKRIRQSVHRFLKWIEETATTDFYIDHEKGMMPIRFFENFLTHTKGKSAGKPFLLSPFQQFTLYNVFGWMESTLKFGPIRRINNVYEKIGKKNGKTAVMAGLDLFHLAFDNEKGAECYIGATKEDQAKLCFNQACAFILKSETLQKLGFKIYQKEIKFIPTNSFSKPLGGDSKTQDGINSSLSIIDEYHAHRDDSVKENLESSMAERLQPLVYTITTAGTNISGVCKKFEDQCIAILDGQLEDDHFFIMIHDLDSDDDWRDSSNWIKANPNLGVTVTKDFLTKEFNKAINQPSKQPNFKTKHLNMWVDAPYVWIPSEIWEGNGINVSALEYEALFIEKALEFGTYAAEDLSTVRDLTSIVFITNPDENKQRYIMPFFFCPKATIDFRSKEDRVPYRYWADNGYLNATPGNTIDYSEIKKTTIINCSKYNTIRVGFDQWNAEKLRNEIAERGIETSYFSQAISVISAPTKELEKLVYEGLLLHNNHPIMNWAMSGCVIYEDANENKKVHKGRSHQGVKRVDGPVAMIMALGESLSVLENDEESQYNNPDKEISFGLK